MPHYLHEGGYENCGGPECEAILASRKRELAEKKAIEEQEQKEQELIQKMNEEITNSPENTNTVEPKVISSEPTNTKEQEKTLSDPSPRGKKIEEQPGNHSCQIISGGYTACGPDDFVAAARQEFTQRAIAAQNKQLQKSSDTAHNLAFKTTIATAPACLGSAIAAFVAPPAAVPLGIICATGTASALGFEVTSEILRPHE